MPCCRAVVVVRVRRGVRPGRGQLPLERRDLGGHWDDVGILVAELRGCFASFLSSVPGGRLSSGVPLTGAPWRQRRGIRVGVMSVSTPQLTRKRRLPLRDSCWLSAF